MDKKTTFFQVIGALAFVIGGIIARENAIEAAETLDKKFSKKKETPEIDSE